MFLFLIKFMIFLLNHGSFLSSPVVVWWGKEFESTLLDWRQPDPIKSALLVIIGWLVGWLVGNTVFSETTLRIFLIFCMKLGNYKGRKVTKPEFGKKILI